MKRAVCLVLCGLFMFTAACIAEGEAAPISLLGDDTALLTDASGREIVPPGEYVDIIPLDESGDPPLFAAGKRDPDGQTRYALMSSEGRPLTEFAYDLIVRREGTIVCAKDDLYGTLNADGSEGIPLEYTSIVPSGSGTLLALRTDCWDDQPDGLYALDASGRETATGVKTLFLFDSAFAEGTLPLLSAENSRYGYVDARGQWVVRPQFIYAMSFSEGKAIASISSGFGVIDTDGNWVLTPRYSLIWRCEDAFIALEGTAACSGFDAETLEPRFRVSGQNLSAYEDGDRFVVTDDEATRLYDAQGDLLFTGPALSSLTSTETGLVILNDGPWGSMRSTLYSPDGEALGEVRQSIYSLGVIDGEEYFGYVTMDAHPADGDDENWDYDPYSLRCGLMDATGAARTEAVFSELLPTGQGCFAAKTEESIGLIDVNGNWIAKWEIAP